MRSSSALVAAWLVLPLLTPNVSAQLALNWTRTVPNSGSIDKPPLVVDNGGNIYVAGTANWYTIVKYSPDGALLWDRQRSTNGGCSTSVDPRLVKDSEGNVILLYQKWNEAESACRCALTKFDANGNELWSQTSQYNCFEVAIDGADGVNVFATLTPSFYFRTQKFSKDGVLQWSTPHTADFVSYAFGIAGHSDGSVYILSNGPLTDNDDIVIIKYSPIGVEQWTATYNSGTRGDDWPGGMILDSSGNVYVVGYSDPNGENDSSAVHDIVTLKYSTSGQQVWVRRFSGSPKECVEQKVHESQ